MVFEKYWDEKTIQSHLKTGDVILGNLRINQKNYEEAFVPHPDGTADIFIEGIKLRNRALNGDVVHVKVFPQTKWKIPIESLNEKVEMINNLVMSNSSGTDKTNIIQDGSIVCSPINHQSMNSPKNVNITNQCPVDSSRNHKNTPNKNKSTNKFNQDFTEKFDFGNENHSAKPEHARFTTLEQILSKPPSNLNQQIVDCLKRLYVNSGNMNFIPTAMGILTELFHPMRTGKVVSIAEKRHNRSCAGTLKSDKNKMAIFSPRDCRVPRIKIPSECCPSGFFERSDDFKHVLFVAKILNWDDKNNFPLGHLEKCVGEVGSIEAETDAILLENGVDAQPFPEDVLACLPNQLPWKIPNVEASRRRDFRNNVVFTIDPDSARDMDDALSCEYLGDGLYEVGVHIADVSYFVRPNTSLDKMASLRSTSVYLVQKVIPMLPKRLCEQLCSLNPGEDRLAFSVVWRMNEQGEVIDEWFGKTMIRSCMKLSYRHAQGFINEPERTWEQSQLPTIYNGVPAKVVIEKVVQLFRISRHLRSKRKSNGTLSLNQSKLSFALDSTSGLPLGWSVYDQLESMSLIEEFMLLANMAVAHKIRTSHPDTALLRRHPPPQVKMLDEFVAFCTNYDIIIDPSSAGALQLSLNKVSLGNPDKLQVLINLCSKCMQQALYFSTGSIFDQTEWHHYALNVPLYTHFTSPIRRYPDVLVHRQLAQALGLPDYLSETKFESKSLNKQCQYSNDKKTNAKLAGDKSIDLYLSMFIQKCGPMEEEGIVLGILDHSFDVFVPKIAAIKRVYCEKMPLERFVFGRMDKRPTMTLVWKPIESRSEEVIAQDVKLFTLLRCRLSASNEVYKWNLEVKHPQES